MRTRFLLLNEAGGIGGDNGGGAGGDAPPVNDGGGNGNGGAPDIFDGPEWAKGWEGVEPEILKDPSLKAIKDAPTLLKSYVHAQKNLGKKGVLIPSENSPKEEWDQFYQKVGVPLEETKYKEAVKFTEHAKLGDEFNQGFLKLAHEARVQPAQAQKLYEYFDTQVQQTSQKITQQSAQQMQAELDSLRDSMGEEAYNVKLSKTVNFLKETAGDEFITYLGQSGLGKNATLVKHLMGLADKAGKETTIPQGDPGYGMTRDELQREINKSFDPTDPYMKPNHPDHARRVAEIQSYYKKLEK
jgi:hypothetical protein